MGCRQMKVETGQGEGENTGNNIFEAKILFWDVLHVPVFGFEILAIF